MIQPINNYVQIEPEKTESIFSDSDTHDEIGIVVTVSPDSPVEPGMRVFFDSWRVSKYPKGDDTFYWLVPAENIKAYEVVKIEM